MKKQLKIVVLAKQVPDTRNVGKDAMTPEGTVNRAALPAIFNPEDLNALEMAPRINSSQSVSELPPRRGLDDKIRIFFDMVYLFICFFKYIYSLTNGFRPSTASAAVMRLPPLSRSMRM